jgi:predicted nucleotidyltransferase
MVADAIYSIAERYAERVKSILELRLLIIFGSQARGNATDASDIDIAVVVDKVDGDFLATEVALFKARRGLDDRIEPVLMEYNSDPSGFLASILREGQVVYSSL